MAQLTFAELKERKRAGVVRQAIMLDENIGAELSAMGDKAVQLEREIGMRPNSTAGEQAALDSLLDDMRKLRDAAIADGRIAVFRFRALGSDEYEQLVNRHKPTQQQRDEADREKRAIAWNLKTFPPALIAEACIEPRMTVDEASSLYDDPEWSAGDLGLLFTAANKASLQQVTVKLD